MFGRRKKVGKRILAAALALVMTATTVVDDSLFVQAEEAEGQAFTVWFNDDKTTNIKAGKYGDYEIYFGENMTGKTNKITVDGVDHYSVQGSNNPKKDGKDPNGGIPNTGCYMKVVAPADGYLTVYGYSASGKRFYATKGDNAALTDSNAFCNDSHSYTVSVKANEEWFFYAQGSKAQFIGVDFSLPMPGVSVDVELKGTDLGEATITLTDMKSGDTVEINKDTTSVVLSEASKYSVGIDSPSLVVDVELVDLTEEVPEKLVFTVSEAPMHQVTGSICGLPEGATVSELVFTDANGAKVNAVVDGLNYSASLKNGSYTTSATVAGADEYTIYDHVLVAGTNGEEIENNVWFYGPATVYGTEYKDTLKVGRSQGCDYATISEALAAVKAMTREAGQRVTLVLCDEEYVEQVIVSSADVSLVAATGVTPVIRWYYGIGYKYYSIDATGYYNVKNANDKFEMHYAQRWGTVVRVTANNFYAEGIEFLNTFNRYVCDEELGDSVVGTAAEYGQKISGSLEERVSGLDVANGKNVERAAAIALDADNAELYKCSFISSQDTVYTGSAKTYFNECLLVGQTDYIFGNTGCAAIFDNCELRWLGYTADAKAGYITATRGSYLFRGCKVTCPKEADHKLAAGYFGRPWGNTANVAFVGTDIEAGAITEAGWKDMDGVYPKDATFREYGNTSNDKYFYSSFAADSDDKTFKLSKEDAEKVADPVNDASYLGTFAPVHHRTAAFDLSAVSDWGTVAKEEEETPAAPIDTVKVLEASKLTAFAAGAKADGDTEKAGTDNYFTIIYSAKSKVDANSKTFEDGYESGQRINFGGVATVEKNAIKFTTDYKATVKIWWVEGGDDNRQMAIFDSTGKIVAQTDVTLAKNALAVSTLELAEAGTYYIGGKTNNNYIFKVSVEEEVPQEIVSTLESSSLTAFAVGAKADGDTLQAGTNDYFTLIFSAKSKVDSNTKTFTDGYTSGQRINFGGLVSVEKNAVKFTTSGPATVKVWWVEGGDDHRQIAILDSTGTLVTKTSDMEAAKNATVLSTLELASAGTYYLGGDINNNYIFKVEVTETVGAKAPRKDWSEVAAPAITNVTSSEGNIVVNVSASVGYDGADKVVVVMTDKDGKEVASRTSSAEKDSHELTFTPEASGDYTFIAKLVRANETDKVSATMTYPAFVLPLAVPVIKSATSVGGGSVEVVWNAVKEATGYRVVGGSASVTTSDLKATLTGLTIGETVIIQVYALRGEESSTAAIASAKVTATAQRVWAFSTFGSSTSTNNDGYKGSLLDDGQVTIYSKNNGGKIVPASTDGLAYYYTVINPETENFTLRAKLHINSWTFTNGQEGFGLMACDAVGVNGDGAAFWNNSYQVIGTKIEYYSDGKEVTGDTQATKITMKDGLGYIAKTGVDAAGLAELKAGATIPSKFVAESGTLETSCVSKNAGVYNLLGNETSKKTTGDVDNLLTDFVLEIQRDNTGYRLRYLDENGNVLNEKLYYDLERDSLTQIDKDNIYLGFFAARTMDITVSDVSLTTIDPSEDTAAEEREIEYIVPLNTIESATVANTSVYSLVYYGNADGKLTVKTTDGAVIADAAEIKANTKTAFEVNLSLGTTKFVCEFTPNADYVPGEFKKLSSYESVTFSHSVTYDEFAGNNIYVSPKGTANGKGTKSSPVDIYTAVKYVKAGQKIVLAGGTYLLSSTVKVERGINGLSDSLIYMIADPEADERPVFDFQGKCAGMILAGDYWYFQGFDVTGSKDGQKGIQVSGSHNVLDSIRAYRNGNTGIQIARYLTTDNWDNWPAYNTVLNCTSYLNADAGYEDADGFAAKLTVADGNVFDGCIAAYNADDGWDLFAKAQTGSIGVVTIQNCIAFKNGYDLDEFGREIVAGNGNGFKMGGESISGAHILKNSVAFANRAKGIDSNSGPNIRVFNSTTVDNESYNVALYTNNAQNTAYEASGILSFRTNGKGVSEQLKLKGTQNTAAVYNDSNFFYDESTKTSKNTAGLTVSADWFEDANVSRVVAVAIEALLNNTFGLAQSDSLARAFNLGITRDANGIIQMNGFLVTTAAVPEAVGATMTGTASKAVSLVKDEDTDKKDEKGQDDNKQPSESEEAEEELVAGDNTVKDNGNGNGTTTTAPKTGDSTRAMACVVIIGLGILAMAAAFFYRKRVR